MKAKIRLFLFWIIWISMLFIILLTVENVFSMELEGNYKTVVKYNCQQGNKFIFEEDTVITRVNDYKFKLNGGEGYLYEYDNKVTLITSNEITILKLKSTKLVTVQGTALIGQVGIAFGCKVNRKMIKQ